MSIDNNQEQMEKSDFVPRKQQLLLCHVIKNLNFASDL